MNAYNGLAKPFFVLAPLDDVTDTVFRRVIAECAKPDLFFTEFVNVDGLQSPGRAKLLKKLRFTSEELPLIVQIWGKNPENFYKTAQQIADGTFVMELGLTKAINPQSESGAGYAGVDLNMGCPDKNVVRNGVCSALINDRDLAKRIIDSTREGLGDKLPLSVKTRIGFNEVDLTWIEFLLRQNLDALTIHGRTKKQMSKVPADWGVIKQCRELRDKIAPKTLIIGNGDVQNRLQGQTLQKQTGVDGVMIGRGVFHDPFAFAQQSPWLDHTREQRIALYKKHVELFAGTWQNNQRPIQTLNKFCKIYINHFEGAKELREQLMSAKSTTELITILNQSTKNH